MAAIGWLTRNEEETNRHVDDQSFGGWVLDHIDARNNGTLTEAQAARDLRTWLEGHGAHVIEDDGGDRGLLSALPDHVINVVFDDTREGKSTIILPDAGPTGHANRKAEERFLGGYFMRRCM